MKSDIEHLFVKKRFFKKPLERNIDFSKGIDT